MKKADKNDAIDKGFVLNEQDFRRLTDTAKEQLIKKGSESDIVFEFTLKFKNGTIYETDNIEEVLGLENGGGGLIKQIESVIYLKNELFRIRIKYSDPDYTDKDIKPIVYSVYGEDRDWVFVSNSQMEERLQTTTRSKLFRPKIEINGIFSLFLMGIFFSFFYFVAEEKSKVYSWDYEKKWEDFTDKKVNVTELLKEFAIEKPNAKPIDVFIKYKEITQQENDVKEEALTARRAEAEKWASEKNKGLISSQYLLITLLLSGLILPFITLIYASIAKYIYPLYVFSWGDEKVNFKKQESAKKYILGTVLTGLIISIVAGIIANLI